MNDLINEELKFSINTSYFHAWKSTNSTSKINVALGGITPGIPEGP